MYEISKIKLVPQVGGLTEYWLDIPGYEARYKVSNFGRVKSLERIVKRENRGTQTFPERLLKLCTTSAGYLRVSLYKEGKMSSQYVHRLVALAFIGNGNGLEVNHIDKNTANNYLSNLEYLTREQHREKDGNGFLKNHIMTRGSNHVCSKLTEANVIQIKEKIHQGISGAELGRQYNVSRQLICDIKNGRAWAWII